MGAEVGRMMNEELRKKEALCVINAIESEEVSYTHGSEQSRTINAMVDRYPVYNNLGAAEQSKIQRIELRIYGGDNTSGVVQVYESEDRFSVRIHKNMSMMRSYRLDKIISFNHFIWVLRLVG